MNTPDRVMTEAERLEELRSLHLVGREADERFDRITRLAQRIFNAPSAFIALVDEKRSWLLSRQGPVDDEVAYDTSFSARAILTSGVTQVRDATQDERFAQRPDVLGDPGVRFFAGCTIVGPRGATLGSLGILDTAVRELAERDLDSLRVLAGMVEREIGALELAASDPLTGLSDQRGFEFSATSLLDLCRQRAIRATLLLFDLDGFQAINETFGHDEGDQALVQFAQHLGSTFRNSDIIARFKDDEFAVLLVDTGDPDVALGRLQSDLVSRNVHPTTRYPLAFSVGSAVFDGVARDSLGDLIKRASAAAREDQRRRENR